MRLARFRLAGFRRFENADIHLDAPVVALVGSNESGKTSLLKALTNLGGTGPFAPRDQTRDYTLDGRVLEASYLLEAHDREVLSAKVPTACGVRWYKAWRDADGSRSHEVVPALINDDEIVSAQGGLNALRGVAWNEVVTSGMADLVSNATATLAGQPDGYSNEQLAKLEELATALKAGEPPSSEDRHDVGKKLEGVVSAERKRRDQEQALSTLERQTPRLLEFSDDARILKSEYNLKDPNSWTSAVGHLVSMGGVSIQQLSKLVTENQPQERWEDLLEKANTVLTEKLSAYWSQVDSLRVRLNVAPPPLLKIFVGAEEGSLHQMEYRSDGLRMFVALAAFLDANSGGNPPILLVDEAENHLHWDAQADLINLFHERGLVSQVIYSTHSPGCLPHDLGNGVRAVAPIPGQADRSYVKNWIWESDSGYRPLLLCMGASAAALTPHRHAVATEGVSDFILLPSLLRRATESDSLPYQVVPGLAQLAKGDIYRIDSESDSMMYLTDGDEAGKNIRREIKRAGIPDDRVFSLPEGLVIEDLVAEETLTSAVLEEIRRSGHKVSENIELPDKGRAAHLDEWFESIDIPPPSKRAIASRVLEIVARNPNDLNPSKPLIEDRHAPTLRKLHELFVSAFPEPSSTPD